MMLCVLHLKTETSQCGCTPTVKILTVVQEASGSTHATAMALSN